MNRYIKIAALLVSLMLSVSCAQIAQEDSKFYKVPYELWLFCLGHVEWEDTTMCKEAFKDIEGAMGSINRDVNWMPQFSSTVGVLTPAGLQGGGDCGDLAIEKMQRLLIAGQPEETMGIITASYRGIKHGVLGIRVNGDILILDNLTNNIRSIKEVKYKFGYVPAYLMKGVSRKDLYHG
jgi:predicted transglutaminase-like cysteine proteinase